MLGLGSSITHNTLSEGIGHVNEIVGYSLHYDMSDASNLTASVADGGDAPDNGDDVATITNLAYAVSGNDAFGKLASNTGGYATWNDSGYLDFSGDSNNYYKSNDNGVDTRVSVGNWSESDAVSTQLSIFIVYKPEAANDSEAQALLQLNGSVGAAGRYIQIKNDIGDDPDHRTVQVYNQGTSGSTDNASDIYDESAAVTLFSMVGKSGANTMIYKNGDTSDGITNFDQDTQAWDMSDAGLALGCRSSSPDVAGLGDFFMGRIYEVLIYNQDLSEESRTFIDNYLINKYSIS